MQNGQKKYGYLLSGLFLVLLLSCGCGKGKPEQAEDFGGNLISPAATSAVGMPTGDVASQDGSSTSSGGVSSPDGSGTPSGTISSPDGSSMPSNNITQGGTISDNMAADTTGHGNAGQDATQPNDNIPGSDSSLAQREPELTPVKKLAPGEHFIFQWVDADNQRNMRIYDENWICRALFERASCNVSGVTDSRYVEFSFSGQAEGNSYTDEIIKKYGYSPIYDLVENEFVDFSKITRGGRISIIDDVKGYFLDNTNSTYGRNRIIDRDGNVIVDQIWIGEDGWTMYSRHGSLYEIVCDEPDWEAGMGVIKIFDSDFCLKAVIYDDGMGFRVEPKYVDGVFHSSRLDGNVFSADGEVVINKERFLAKFGDGKNMDCKVLGGGISWENTEENWLYPVEYAGQTWYVDTKLNAYIREGETRMTILDEREAPASYYVVNMEDGEQFFAPDGSPLLEGHQVKNPHMLVPTGNESYMLIGRKIEEGILVGYEVEMVVPHDNYCQVHLCDFLSAKPGGIKPLSPYVISLNGWRAKEYGEMQEELWVYKKGQPLVFTAKEVGLSQGQSWDGSTVEYEDTWVVSMWDGKQQDEKTGKNCIYTVLLDGEVRATIPTMGQLVDCHDGYLQIHVGENNYVYDYDGNLVLRMLLGE